MNDFSFDRCLPGNFFSEGRIEASDISGLQGKTLARRDQHQTRKVSLSHLAAGTCLLRYTDGTKIISARIQKL